MFILLGGDSEWVDIVESELRQILEPKHHSLNVGGTNSNQGIGAGVAGSEVSSVTPPLPPLSPAASSPEATPRNSSRFKHQRFVILSVIIDKVLYKSKSIK